MEAESRKIVAFLPLRGGSKSIPDKNIKLMAGKPLAVWALESVQQSHLIDEVVVSTDSDKIRRIITPFAGKKTRIIGRSIESASDIAPTEKALLEFANDSEFDDIVLFQATSPLLHADYISDAIVRFSNSKADSMVSVTKQHIFLWENQDTDAVFPLNYDPCKRPRRQDSSGVLVENGAFYITKRDVLLKYGCRIGGKIIPYILPKECMFEVDDELDWNVVENILLQHQKRQFKNKSNIKLIISDVDGVLTDGGMYYSASGELCKKFNTRDGMAVELARKNGIDVVFVTGELSEIVIQRGKKLNVETYVGIKDKLPCVNEIVLKKRIKSENVIYIGDDLNDIEVINHLVFSVCPLDAALKIKTAASMIANVKGGGGVLRWVVDFILESSNE